MRITGITIEADSVVIKGSEFDALCALGAENERLKHRCNALAYLHYGHYMVQRTRDSIQADIEACESALTALRAELRTLSEHPKTD